MFIKYIKEISVKKILKRSIHNVKPTISASPIQSVGILIDESYFKDIEQFTQEIVNKGIQRNSIKIIIYKDKIKKTDVVNNPTFSYKNMQWNGNFDADFVNEFIKTPFDMLISYYDVEKTPLLLVTHNSKAIFKVGMYNVDKRLNHLMINTVAENYVVFTQELFKYLKILKKI
ncbi:DUF6913 domain-containing protein [Flavobacterium sp.]|uniref:DUF6913 domain-containing protein n=1 Tax=Flavobacterium sp. TaxID=239 RepID=UPI00286E8D45|nr:hypothetical protein [Flavobacterium sp.]